MSDEQFSVAIPLRAIWDAFVCPICLGEITDAHMTPCGHNGCSECLLEALNRRHACPICNAETTKEKLIKNHHLDALFQRVHTEKEAVSKALVARLMEGSKGGGSQDAKSAQSPIEQVFQKHARRSLLAYEDYYSELERAFNKKRLQLRTELQSESCSLQAVLLHGPAPCRSIGCAASQAGC